jgi:hypothetical protein
MITPDNELFRVNSMGIDNFIEAAVTLGIKRSSLPRARRPEAFLTMSRSTSRTSPRRGGRRQSGRLLRALKDLHEKTTRVFATRSGFDI